MLFLKWLVTQKLHFLQGVPHQYTRLFCWITVTFKRPSLRLFRFKIAQFVPFWNINPQNLSKICKNGANCEILKQKNRRLGRLKVHVIEYKNSCADGGNPIKKLNFWATSPFKVIFAYNNISLCPSTLHTKEKILL